MYCLSRSEIWMDPLNRKTNKRQNKNRKRVNRLIFLFKGFTLFFLIGFHDYVPA